MARVRISQWENDRIPLPVLSAARMMIAQRDNECISLSVLAIVRVKCPAMVNNFERSFLWLITLSQPILNQHGTKLFNLPSTAPDDLWTLRSDAKIQPWTVNGRNKNRTLDCTITLAQTGQYSTWPWQWPWFGFRALSNSDETSATAGDAYRTPTVSGSKGSTKSEIWEQNEAQLTHHCWTNH